MGFILPIFSARSSSLGRLIDPIVFSPCGSRGGGVNFGGGGGSGSGPAQSPILTWSGSGSGGGGANPCGGFGGGGT